MSNRGDSNGSGMLDNITSSFSNSSDAGLSNGEGFGLKAFMESNSYVAKFAFILMVVIVFWVVMKPIIIGLSFLLLPSMSPYILDGTASTDSLPIYVPQDPAATDSVFVARSTNEDGGLEYTWSTWFLINKPPSENNIYSRIFSKGGEGSKSSATGIYYPNNAPGLYIKVTDDVTVNNADRTDTGRNISLVAVVDVNGKGDTAALGIDDMNEQLIATDIPMKKWVNAIIRVTNNVIDLYINGRLVQRRKTGGIPLQNYGKINIGENKAIYRFTGYISTIQYFNYSVGANKITSIVDSGPKLNMVAGGDSADQAAATKAGSYLSNNWFVR
jgi:hypothetical protein